MIPPSPDSPLPFKGADELRHAGHAAGATLDRRLRPLHDLRISITDRCNFRCTYCMPREAFGPDFKFLPREQLLTFEEIERSAQAFVALGVHKIRITGGEPLMRKGVDVLLGRLSSIRTNSGTSIDLSLTTNGSLLVRKAEGLAAAGLRRLNVSLDALDETVFHRMTDTTWSVRDVLDGIAAASAAGIGPIKINMVVKRGINDDQIVPMAKHFQGTGHILRFIEFMDVGNANHWSRSAVYPSSEILALLHRHIPLVPLAPSTAGEVAKRWAYRDGSGEIGVISSVTEPFCGDCSRARLSAVGQVYLCLFAQRGFDLRAWLRQDVDDKELQRRIADLWKHRSDQYSETRGISPLTRFPKVEMSYIGG